MSNKIFVFGSNEGGFHGAGSALFAYQKRGAVYGKSYGHYGDSFAIPTKDIDVQCFKNILRIEMYVQGFLAYAIGHRKLTFEVTRIGCGLAGFTDEQIAPLFLNAPKNCKFDSKWEPIFSKMGFHPEYWGTY